MSETSQQFTNRAPQVPYGTDIQEVARSARTLGIVSIVFAFFAPLVSWICGGIGLSKAKSAYKRTHDASLKSGKTLCTVGIVLSVVITVVIMIIVIAFTSAATSAVVDTVDEITTTQIDQTTGQIGDYTVTVKDSVISKTTYDDEDVLVVTYEFTNNSDSSTSFLISIDDTAYQDGVECSGEFYNTSETEGFEDVRDNWDNNIKPGKTAEVVRVYTLNDTTTDVDIEIGESISFSDDVLEYSISLK